MTTRAAPAGPRTVAGAVSGPCESRVASVLAGRRDVVLVRRCADVAELLAVVEAGLATCAVVSAGFPDLDGDVVERLRGLGCHVVGVVDPDRESSERLQAWAVPVLPLLGEDPGHPQAAALVSAVLAPGRPGGPGGTGDAPGSRSAEVAEAARDAEGPRDAGAEAETRDDRERRGGGGSVASGPGSSESWFDGLDDAAGVVADGRAGATAPADARPSGRLVAVWGPAGAPGRTTVAVGVAAELAAAGHEVLLVDADTYAASVAQVLGLLDEAPGLVAAVRAGLEGRLGADALARAGVTAAPRLHVLTGLTRASRWSEVRPAGLRAVLQAARESVDVVVLDLATPLESDEELTYDTSAPRRNGTTLEVLAAADEVLVVGAADPVGLQRLVRGLQDLAGAVPGCAPRVVVNKLRADAVGRSPRSRVREALDRFAGVRDLWLVPDDRAACDRALLAGRTLAEHAPDSPARHALRDLAAELARRLAPVAPVAPVAPMAPVAPAAPAAAARRDGGARRRSAGREGRGAALRVRSLVPRRWQGPPGAPGATGR